VNRKLWAFIVVIGVASVASAVPRGTVPKSSVEEYRAHAERDGVGIGAVLLTSDQVHKAFAANVSKCCLVFEVAFYPSKDKPLDVSLDDLTMKAEGSDTLVRPLSARAVAATLQEKAERDQNKNVAVATNVGVGYESGTYIDPVTGNPTKVHGVTTEAGAGVAVGAPAGSQPGASNRSRDNAEIELEEHGLVEGSASAPVSGYLYFSKPEKMKKNTQVQLQYALKNQTVVLSLP
jgi:hypothetical protein